MNRKSNILFLFFIIYFIQVSIAQDCINYHEKCDKGDVENQIYNGQSKSLLSTVGQITRLKIVAFRGIEYCITVCGEEELGFIHIRIYVDNKEKTLLFDNENDKKLNNICFSNRNTRKLIIEAMPKGKELSKLITNNVYCMGILIEHKYLQTENRKI